MRLFILIPFLFLSSARADWNQNAISFAQQNFSRYPGPQSPANGFIATLWGGAYREALLGGYIPGYSRPMILPRHFAKPLMAHVALSWRKEGPEHFLRKAPLVVFLPGVFSETESITGKLTVRWFGAMGYHVVILPNPWSRAYQTARPLQVKGYPQDEGSAIRAATRFAIDQMIGADHVTRVEVVGESLGAFTAAVAYGLDTASKHPVFSGGGTFFWPPISIASSIATLDQQIAETRSIYEDQCSSLTTSLTFVFRLLRGLILSAPSATDLACAGPLVVQHSFQRNLVDAANSILEFHPNRLALPRLEAGWESRMNFTSFIQQLAPQYKAALSFSRPENRLDYWLAMAQANGRREHRVFSSEDDFINARESWRRVRAVSTDRNLIVTSWGGHIGLTSAKQFPIFLGQQFAEQND